MMALLVSACADLDNVVDGDMEEVDPGEEPSEDVDCSLEALEFVTVGSTPGTVGDAEVSNECNSVANEQRLRVCIQVAPPNPDSLTTPPPDGVNEPGEDIGCETVVGTSLTVSTLEVPGRAGNNWYRHWITVEVDATNNAGGTTTNVFEPTITGWNGLNCFEAVVDECVTGFVQPPPPAPTPTPAPTPAPTPTPPPLDDGDLDDCELGSTLDEICEPPPFEEPPII